MVSTKKRLDILLVEKGFCSTRQKSQALIFSGNVLVNNIPVDKAGALVRTEDIIRIRGEQSRFVSRGGDKIDPAFDFYHIDIKDQVALDLGASTGGFTDCMLQRGARKVYAVDVGYNQLDYKLRVDSRVVVMEKTHAKDLANINFEPKPQFVTIDVSFIGIRKVLPYVVNITTFPQRILALIKPQFELGPEYVAEGGVVRKPADQLLAVKLVREYATSLGLYAGVEFPSPLKGEKRGNQEYFLYLTNDEQ